MLENIILDDKLIADFPNLVKFKHSGNIEVYHNVIGKYCPKRLSFSYEGMHARTQLAVMSHNAGINRKQAVVKKTNKPRTKQQYSKVTGQWVAKKVMEPMDMKFLQDIVDDIPKVGSNNEKNDKLEEVPKNIAAVPNPGKDVILANQRSRFSKAN